MLPKRRKVPQVTVAPYVYAYTAFSRTFVRVPESSRVVTNKKKAIPRFLGGLGPSNLPVIDCTAALVAPRLNVEMINKLLTCAAIVTLLRKRLGIQYNKLLLPRELSLEVRCTQKCIISICTSSAMIATKYQQAGKCAIALGYYMAALSLGDLSAVSRIANYLRDGRPDVPADPEAARALIKMGMRCGDSGCIAMSTWFLITEWNNNSSPYWYVAQRMNNLPPTDFSAIVNAWLLLNHPKSPQEAKVYDEHDKEIASMLMIKAADEHQHDRTMFEAAVCILIDRTGTWDVSKAYELFNRSAIQGFPPAMWRLGDCFRYGWGVEVNLCEAITWYKRASAAGCDCSNALAEIEHLLSDKEMASE